MRVRYENRCTVVTLSGTQRLCLKIRRCEQVGCARRGSDCRAERPTCSTVTTNCLATSLTDSDRLRERSSFSNGGWTGQVLEACRGEPEMPVEATSRFPASQPG